MSPDPARAVLDDLPDGVVLAGGDGLVRLVSAPAARMLGIDADEAPGRPLPDVLRLQDREGASWCACNTPYEGLATRTAVPEQPWLLPDGSEVLVAARIHRTSLRDPVDRVAVTLR